MTDESKPTTNRGRGRDRVAQNPTLRGRARKAAVQEDASEASIDPSQIKSSVELKTPTANTDNNNNHISSQLSSISSAATSTASGRQCGHRKIGLNTCRKRGRS